jgi:hypothetical protein
MISEENDEFKKRINELEAEIDKIQREKDKITTKFEDVKKELLKVEKENEQMKKIMNTSGDAAKMNQLRLKNLEIDNEAYERQLR